MAPSTSAQPAYSKDEKVLCFHHELLYEAKVVEAKVKDLNDKKDGYLYRVHYKGWKNTWDDWVPQERLRKFTDENKELASNLKKDMDAQRRAASGRPASTSTTKKRPYGSDLAGSSARGSEDRSSAVPQPPRGGTKRGREIEGIDKMKVDKHRAATSSEEAKHSLQMSSAESAPALAYSEKRYLKVAHMHTELTPAGALEEDFLRRPAVRLFMPDALKSILVDDWEKVTKEQKLAPVPSPTPVTQFLNEYEASEMAHRRPNSAEADILEEVVAGVKEYFNKSLGRILLYRFERQQFYEMHKAVEAGHGEHAGKTLADLYGCEHLLRLFVSLPDLIAHTNMDQQSVSRLREELTKMTSWMAKRLEKYLGNEYQHAGQEYLESAKNGA
ncbi:Esa1p-associated factor [Friedmanniomyces endolithicus]|uniref:Chromatin modification-related protein EAF3 n=1 Tax=Friedmanniomyces endolithicus TaxID=329885 RepID=A0AAN6KQ03_9PEZI|nr:Esa1p-associated factor [Friedmanniomyces endolithicus]KAK0958569.1 Esa1p-associated factor [Friedmanniomyces endolithicus]KAK0994856.1 Esa1p-associated factor [Friedmanniomyces endolithicus]KAK1044829.1 Esa1p-associated factor [Friedmanniomyces endolithicus]